MKIQKVVVPMETTQVNKKVKQIFARPNQALRTHIKNMLLEGMKQLKKKANFTLYSYLKDGQLYNILLEVLIIGHDFGKINPYFQEKIVSSQKKKGVLKKAYHSQLGALFSWIVLQHLIEEVSEIEEEEITNELKLHALAIVFAIFNHHNHKTLPNDILSSVGKYSNTLSYDDMAELISEINKYYDLLSEKKDALIKELFVTIVKDEMLKTIIRQSIDEFLALQDSEAIEDLFFELEELWEEKKEDNKLFHLILFYFSLLCDLDEWDAKSHINDTEKHSIAFDMTEIDIRDDIIEYYRNRTFEPITIDTKDPLLKIKQKLWEDVKLLSKKDLDGKIISITYPTGSGKTLAFLHLAMKIRERKKANTGVAPRIIYCLPYISITDQVGNEIKKILRSWFTEENKTKLIEALEKQSEILVTHHHLAEAEWSYLVEEESDEKNYEINFRRAREFINLWNANIIVTTYVSFWNSILGGRKKNYLRFHRLTGSIIIFDEIQTIPIKYWELIASLIHQLVFLFNCTIIVGSATNPKALTYQYDWNTYLAEVEEIQINNEPQELDRYTIIYENRKEGLLDFAQRLCIYIKNNRNKAIMAVLNTRKSARMVFDYLTSKLNDCPLYFLSSAVTHKDRRKILEEIKNKEKRNERRILICTQVIEAGIDVTFDVVFRDIAPLDSIIQVAGRCNRYNKEKGEVYIVELTEQERPQLVFHKAVYDQIMIEQTKKILAKHVKINERELRKIGEEYYNLLTLEGRKKKFDMGVEELRELLIETLTEEFKLIEEEQNETLVLCENENEVIDLATTADSSGTKWGVIWNYRDKMIAITEKIREKLSDKLKLEKRKLLPIILTEDDKIWALLLVKNDWVYQENGGLNIPKILEDEG